MARKNIGAKPYIMPMPVLMLSAYEAWDEKPCAMLAVWGGISNEKELTITVASERQTLKGILARQAFVVSMGTVETATQCDYLGITKGGKVSFDKFHPLAFDWMNKIYLSLDEKVGNAYKDGLALKEILKAR